MTVLKMSVTNFEKWIHQNAAEIIDCAEGCLLDNYLLHTRRGVAAVYEHYVNPNMSDYRVYFAAYNTPEADDITDKYYDNTEYMAI